MAQAVHSIINYYSVPVEKEADLKKELQNTFKQRNSKKDGELTSLQTELNRLTNRLGKVEDSYFSNLIIHKVYERNTVEIKTQIEVIRTEIKSTSLEDLSNFLNFLLSLSKNLSRMWQEAGFHTKQTIQNLLFPKGVCYDRENSNYRTIVLINFLK